MTSLAVEDLRQIQDADIPELRRIWDYNRGAERSKLALRRLDELGQVGPDGKPCVWGTVVEKIEVGDFTLLVSKHDHAYTGYAPDGTCRTISPDEVADVRTYHIYVAGKDIGRSSDNLDAALLIAIAWKYESMPREGDDKDSAWGRAANSDAVYFIRRMIGMTEVAAMRER